MSQTQDDKKSPRTVHFTKAVDVKTGKDGQTEGMERQAAIVGKSPSICGTLMRAHPHSSSAVHHHGDQDTIVYAVSGHGAVVTSSNDKDGDERQVLAPGDWALIPAYREHQEVNEGEEEVVWVIVRAPGGTPEVVNLQGWGESRK
ncbi:RmlC-like cupin domain-containing protein [Exophiala viscosa]|uniref:RmlC-like cupin domain-containing protein n=1 Tax=Exophiala viscosa TaxID=2486360 RepID=UPI00219521B9|nr:RmlC-like cupin domain-containing protein [Exophiala viscosa]